MPSGSVPAFNMDRRLSAGLVLARLFQVLASFTPGAMNGWLLYYLHSNKLGPSDLMRVLEILIAAIFAHSLCSILVFHTGRRSRGTPWMVASICLDVAFCFVDVTIISLLSSTGLPSNCAGLTPSNWSKVGGKADPPSPGYSTDRFSDEQHGQKGELDKFCDMERGFFFCAVWIILAYLLTIVLSVLRICELNYTRNSEVQRLLHERETLLTMERKVHEDELHAPHRSPASPSGPTPPFAAMPQPSRADGPAASPSFASMARPAMPTSTSRSSAIPPPPSRFPGVHRASRPASSACSSAHHHLASRCAHTSTLPSSSSSSSSSSSPAVPRASMPPPPPPPHAGGLDATSEMHHANMAMISDGARYNGGGGGDSSPLPPYSPSNERTMLGHGREDNDIRLSDYVKGGTRAQDMKDSGHFR